MENYQALGLKLIIKDKTKDVEDQLYRPVSNPGGELLQDSTGSIYWVQGKKFYIPSFALIEQMRFHQIPGWGKQRKVDFIPRLPGPPFYFTDVRSNGLLLKSYHKPPVFLIENAQKHYLADEYSFENYRYQGRLLEWGDIISVPEEILAKFPTDSPLQIRPTLSSPANGSTIDNLPVTICCKPHQNKTWEYHFQVADKQDFAALICEDAVSWPRFIINNLLPGKYFWRVQGVKHGREESAWSETWSVTIVTPGDEG